MAAGPFTPRNLLVGYLPQAVASLRAQHEQLARRDLHPQNCSLVGCSNPLDPDKRFLSATSDLPLFQAYPGATAEVPQ